MQRSRLTSVSHLLNSASIIAFVLIASCPVARAPAVLSSDKTGAELSLLASRFEDPLRATAAIRPGENTALLAAIRTYEARRDADDFIAIHSFLSDYPRSGWRIALLTNLGLS